MQCRRSFRSPISPCDRGERFLTQSCSPIAYDAASRSRPPRLLAVLLQPDGNDQELVFEALLFCGLSAPRNEDEPVKDHLGFPHRPEGHLHVEQQFCHVEGGNRQRQFFRERRARARSTGAWVRGDVTDGGENWAVIIGRKQRRVDDPQTSR